MRINPQLKLRKIVNEHIILLPSVGSDRSTRIVSLNPTSQFLWENLCEVEFTTEDGVKLLMDNYEVEAEQAQADFEKWIEQLRQFGAIIDEPADAE